MENKKAVAVENAAEDTIDLLEIFRALYRRWVWIVFVALVFGIALGMYGKFVVKDVFQAEASMCIIDSNKEVSMSDLQVGSALTNDYEGIIKSRVVLTKVISNLNLDIAYKNLYNAVSVDNPEATRIIRIRVVSGNKEEAVDIANKKAPEHLELCINDAKEKSVLFHNYGSLFIGNYSAEVFGDYTSGTNHTLPTNGVAKYSGGLSVFDYIKIQTYQMSSRLNARHLAKTASILAQTEGLWAHKLASDLRK